MPLLQTRTMPNRPASERLLGILLTLCLWAGIAGSGGAQAAPGAELWAFWKQSNEANTETIDHSTWQTILDTHLITLTDGRTAFRYQAVSAQHKATLANYLAELAARDPRRYSRDTQMAYWINLYNALTVQVVLDHPNKKSILRMGGGWLPRGPWDDDAIQIADQTLTLNDIEHRILRPIWQDHRIHFAVNCASYSCPKLFFRLYKIIILRLNSKYLNSLHLCLLQNLQV